MTLAQLMALAPQDNVTLRDEILYQIYSQNGGSGSFPYLYSLLNAVSGLGAFTDISTRYTALSSAPQTCASGMTVGFSGLNGLNFYNPNAVPVFLKFFDDEDINVTVGVTVPVWSLMIPALGQVVLDSTSVYFKSQSGFISVAAVTGYADNNSTAPATGLSGTLKFLDMYQ